MFIPDFNALFLAIMPQYDGSVQFDAQACDRDKSWQLEITTFPIEVVEILR
ncbi:hypothetical protein TUM4644_01340 [Shewanella colwelliana]|nr:hypothetical protein TUM4644_01340 [Shewanella colwelliana]